MNSGASDWSRLDRNLCCVDSEHIVILPGILLAETVD